MSRVAIGVPTITEMTPYHCGDCGTPVALNTGHARALAAKGAPVVCTACEMQRIMRELPPEKPKKLGKGQQARLFSIMA